MDEDDVRIFEDLKDEIEVVYLDDLEGEDMLELNEEENREELLQEDVVDLAKLTFSKHTRSVFSGTLSKNGLVAATGGEDDMAYVWSTETLELLLECTGHKDSVTEVAFNFDDQYIATGDMGGLIQVWSLKEKKLLWCYEGDDMEWLLWHPLANVLFAGSHSGDIYIWQIPQGNCKVLASHGCSTTCGRILSDGKRLLVGYSDGQVRLWDIKTATVLWQLVENIPESGITSLDVMSDCNLFIVAPSGQLFKVADGRQTGTILTTNEQDIEVVAINNESGLAATGALSGKFCVWDLKKNNLRHEAKLEASITVLKWGPQERLFVGTTDGCVYVCDARSGTLIEILTGHQADILSLSLTKNGSTVLSTSDDGTAKLFSVKTE